MGLGDIPDKIVEIIGGLRRLVDEAIDWLIEQALRLGRAALDALGLGQQQPESTDDRPVLETFELVASNTRSMPTRRADCSSPPTAHTPSQGSAS